MASPTEQGPPALPESLVRAPVALRRALATGLFAVALAAVGAFGGSAPAAAPKRCDVVASPADSASDVVNSLQTGQTACFRAGTYAFSRLGVDQRNITLAPYRSQDVTLKGEIKVRPGGAGSTIRGMTLDGRGGASRIGPRIYASRVTLLNNEITNHHTSICVQIGRYYDGPPPQGVRIVHNMIHDCGELPTTNKDHGIYVSEARGTVIRDNWIYDNVDRGIQLYPDADGSRITGNVIVKNGDGMVINESSSDNQIYGNVIADSVLGWNIYGGNDSTGSNNIFRDNCVRASNEDSDYNVNGGIQSPQIHFTATENRIAARRNVFVDRRSRDLRLKWHSSCRGKYNGGLSDPWAPKR
jgi:parallel beta-helix repeat protein